MAEGRLIKMALLYGHPGGRLRVNLSWRTADADVYDSSTCNLYYTLFHWGTTRRRMHTRNIVMIAVGRVVFFDIRFRKRFEIGEKMKKKQINKRRDGVPGGVRLRIIILLLLYV